MSIIGSIYAFFRLSDEEIAIYDKEISLENTRRAFYLTLISVPVTLIHVILFALKLKVVTGIERLWVFSIIYTHLSVFILTMICGSVLYFSYYRRKKNNLPSRICANIVLLALLLMGALLTTFDQYVTPAITPFLITTILVGIFFQLRPKISLLFFALSYAIFYIGISITQIDQDVLISNQVNGVSITAIGLCLSMVLWRSNLNRIKQREKISKQNKALSESNAEKDKFFSIIAHDLKSPFNSILGFSDILITQVKEKDYEGIDQYAQIINQSSKSAMDLLMNLMEWSKAHTGRMEFKPEFFELNDLIRETESLFKGALLHKKISLAINMPDETIVFADKNMIRTILRNLISNAIKFTYPDGNVVIGVEKSLNGFLISVTDDGVGIPKESINSLFRIDQNYSTLGTFREKGTGLGLILCKELIGKHNGRIWGESEYGKGSKFVFTLPVILPDGVSV